VVFDDGVSIIKVPGIDVHLGTAGLPGRVNNLMPQAF
jgi:hypothetical protein